MNLTKIIRPCTVDLGYGAPADLFCRIVIADGRLSITGVEGPRPGGNCAGSCGQIDMHEWRMVSYAPGWDAARVQSLRQMWQEWHLNDMRAGSPAQRAYLKAHPDLRTYDSQRDALREAGLSPDPSYLHNGKPYVYGSAWLVEPLPQEVIDALAALPDADKTPAWV